MSDLIEYLKNEGTPRSRPTLISYEKQGLIQSPTKLRGIYRVYTLREMEGVAKKVKKLGKRHDK